MENTGSLAAVEANEALGEIQRHDHADESAAHALEQAPEEQRAVSVRERDDRDADDESEPLRIISGLRPIQSASIPANSVEKTLPSSTAATMMESCPAFKPGGGFEIRQRAADDADVDSVEQAAEARDKQKNGVLQLVVHRGGRVCVGVTGVGHWKSIHHIGRGIGKKIAGTPIERCEAIPITERTHGER